MPFASVWAVDFEFTAHSGEPPMPICLVARELISGRERRVWEDELLTLAAPPYPIGPRDLFIAYYASAELGCHLALGWPMPPNVLDLYVEFRCRTNGAPVPCGHGLLGALTYFGLDAMAAEEKATMRQLALRGGPFTAEERAGLLDYCACDVQALAQLYAVMAPRVSWPHAIHRGRFMIAAARIERAGIPLDVPTLEILRAQWDTIKLSLVTRIESAAIRASYDEGGHFHADRFAGW